VLLALWGDYLSVGPDSIRDRLAFFLALPAIYEGFNGSPLDDWTVGRLSAGITELLSMTKGAYIAGASVNVLLSAAVGLYALYVAGILLPNKLSSKVGDFLNLNWRKSGLRRLNWQLWTAAVVLGMLCDLPRGAVGESLMFVVELLDQIVSPIPNWMFGPV
jgi:hypothetical protein